MACGLSKGPGPTGAQRTDFLGIFFIISASPSHQKAGYGAGLPLKHGLDCVLVLSSYRVATSCIAQEGGEDVSYLASDRSARSPP